MTPGMTPGMYRELLAQERMTIEAIASESLWVFSMRNVVKCLLSEQRMITVELVLPSLIINKRRRHETPEV